MSKTAGIILAVAAACAGFAIGLRLGTLNKHESPSSKPSPAIADAEPAPRFPTRDLSNADRFPMTLAEKEKRISELEAQLMQVRAELLWQLSSPEKKPESDRDEGRHFEERRLAAIENSKELRYKILQRADKALRTQGLNELAALLQSQNAEDVFLALTVLANLDGIGYDRERFTPLVVAALTSEDPDVCRIALSCFDTVCPAEDKLDYLLALAQDPSLKFGPRLVQEIGWLDWRDRKGEIEAAIRRLLHSEDQMVKMSALSALSYRQEHAEEMEALAIEMSEDAENAKVLVPWLASRQVIGQEVAQRLAEMYDPYDVGNAGVDWTKGGLSDEAKPVAADFCLRVLREGIQRSHRMAALEGLRKIGDVSLVPELEEITRTVDAEGIEEQLAETIESLRKRADPR